MRKAVAVFFGLVCMAYIAGCGGSSSTTATTNYDLPIALVPPYPAVLGGAIQGTPLALNVNVSTLAGNAGTSGSADTAPGVAATFNHPTGITTDGTNLYVTDYNNNLIRKIDSTGTHTLQCTDSSGAPISFNRPTDITIVGTNLYVVDSGSNTVRIIDATTFKVETIGSTTGLAGSVDTAVQTDARFNQPTGITTDSKNLYITDSGNHTIRWIDIASKKVSTLAGAPGTAGSADGKPRDARFNLPARITTNGSDLYLTDLNNRTIRKIVISSGEVFTIAGNASTPPGTTDANAIGADARFYKPNGITTDGTNLYVTDSFNNTIRKISLTAPYNVEKITGVTYAPDQAVFSGHVDSADGTPSFDTPIGITTDGTSLFVADSQNNTIRKIQ